jgi:hypothetical protein
LSCNCCHFLALFDFQAVDSLSTRVEAYLRSPDPVSTASRPKFISPQPISKLALKVQQLQQAATGSVAGNSSPFTKVMTADRLTNALSDIPDISELTRAVEHLQRVASDLSAMRARESKNDPALVSNPSALPLQAATTSQFRLLDLLAPEVNPLDAPDFLATLSTVRND